ncbi:hypothetical protein TIFTF001_045321 [Ficus carica]|uniref:Bifunctional inhibitor/plant lipid transfer protein/seed storage helical domain-containing protein n=1 Tax=Ficus carica TaxID=3494 RepID=A0AA87YPZ0_FICCA|nr:hypothetical protein TIFTF001_045321 [Ficus carica]
MEIFCIRTLALAIFVLTGTLMFGNYGVSATTCQIDVRDVVTECAKFVSKLGPEVPPSHECCEAIKPIDVQCACKLVTEKIEKLISMDKAVYVARTCGIDVPKGMKCGDYTVPNELEEIIA